MSLFWLAFLLALGVRFFDLGRGFLSNAEAIPALQALGTAQGARPLIGDQPGYTLLTSLLFFSFGSNEFFARFWPALIGSLVVWVPFQFRRFLGGPAALVLAFCLVLDPGLVAISRQANGVVLGVVFTLLAAGFFINRQLWQAGICAGLAILGGPGFWFAVPPLVIVALWTLATARKNEKNSEEPGDDISLDNAWLTNIWKPLPWTAITLVGVGSLFYFAPSGLGGIVEGLTTYLGGWVGSNGGTIFGVLFALVVYELMPILFGFWGILARNPERDGVDPFLARWFLAALVFIIVYPAHEVPYLVWVTLPLWALAARQIVRQLNLGQEEYLVLVGYVALIFALIIFIWMSFVYIANNPTQADEYRDRWIVILVACVMIVLLVLLMRWGWGPRASGTGVFIGLALAMALFTISAAWNAGGLGRRPDTEMWRKGPYPVGADLLVQTVTDFYQWRGMDDNPMSLQVVGVDMPSIRWALRNFTNVSFSGDMPTGSTPALIITPMQDPSQMRGNYTGESIVWEQQPAWINLFPTELEKWAVVREVPVEKTTILLWARSDLFPGRETSAGKGQ
jgi:hypothetical protein